MSSDQIKRIAVLTSGGDSPGMNACIRSVVRSALDRGVETVGVMRGFEGLLSREFYEFEARSVANIIQRGGTMLMSSRCEKFRRSEQRSAAYLNLKNARCDALVAIGGDGTMRGLDAFCAENPTFPVMGVPGTIDNDLDGSEFTIGFDTALNTALEMVDRIRDTASSYDRVMVVEVMGRESGQIAFNVALACGAEAVLLPEMKDDMPTLAGQLKASHERGKHSQIVVVAEAGEPGRSTAIAQKLEKLLDIPVRVAVLGYVQRGGKPSAKDRILAAKLGNAAVAGLLTGQTRVMAGMLDGNIIYTPLAECVGSHRAIPQNLLDLLAVLAK